MNNIFENTYFGKVYKTRDGRKALFQTIYQNRRVWAMVDKCPQLVPYHLDGTCEGDECFDIVSEWQEPINEEELARQYAENSLFGDKTKKQVAYTAYLRGYRKAMEDK